MELFAWSTTLSTSPQVNIKLQLHQGIRCFGGQLEPALFMALVEQLVLDCEHSRLKDILEFLKRNPFYEGNNHAQIIYLYRLVVVRLTQLISKVAATPTERLAILVQYYLHLKGAVDGFAMAFQKLAGHFQSVEHMFQQLGIHIILQTFTQNQWQNRSGPHVDGMRTITVIQDQNTTYAILTVGAQGPTNPHYKVKFFTPLDQPSNGRQTVCSLCTHPSKHLFNNLFCKHLYCKVCLQNYITLEDQSRLAYQCPKRNCRAKMLRALLMQQNTAFDSILKVSIDELSRSKSTHHIPSMKRLDQSALPKPAAVKPKLIIDHLQSKLQGKQAAPQQSAAVPQQKPEAKPQPKPQQPKPQAKPFVEEKSYIDIQRDIIKEQVTQKSKLTVYEGPSKLVKKAELYCGNCLSFLDEQSQGLYQPIPCNNHLLCFECQFSRVKKCIICG